MVLLRVLLLVTVYYAATAAASRILFPGQLKHTEYESCRTHLNTEGTCERSCGDPSIQSELRKCGIKESAFLFCCDPNLTKIIKTGKFTDISPPFTTFECGKNAQSQFSFDYRYNEEVQPLILRPVTTLPLPVTTVTTVTQPTSYDYDYDYGYIPEDFIAHAVGGTDAKKNAWPWMALVGKRVAQKNVWFCGGALINEQWVVSAAHCFLYHTAQVVRLGEHDYQSDDEGAAHLDFDVVETVVYPDYSYPQAYHDIALLKLAYKVTLQTFISPVCLPWGRESDSVMTNKTVTLTGWGDTEYGGHPSAILQEVDVTVFPVDKCDLSYSNLGGYATTFPQGIREETVCAGDPNGGRDACQGDSGGPLVSQKANGIFVLAGIVSLGHGCGRKEYPGLYANVRHPPHLAWIKNIAFASP